MHLHCTLVSCLTSVGSSTASAGCTQALARYAAWECHIEQEETVAVL